MKIQRFLKNRLFIYLLGIIVGVSICFASFNIYASIKASSIENKLQDKVTDQKKIDRFVDSNKDFIVAGLLLSPENKKILGDKINQMPQEESKKIKSYIEIKIKPLYKNFIVDYINNKFESLDFNNFKNKFSSFLRKKINLIFFKLSNNIQDFIAANISGDKISDAIRIYLNKNIDLNAMVESIKEIVTEYLNENIDLNIMAESIKGIVIEYLNENIDLNVMVESIKKIVTEYLNENIDLNVMTESIKEIVIEYLNENIDLNIMIENIKDTILDFIINSNLVEDINNLINKINYLFSDVDDDYHFGQVNIGTVIVDLSFLNILDLYIDPTTAIYDNGGTIINLQDDSLIIKDIYVNLEAINNNGLDIIIGQVNTNGRLAYIIYRSIGVINEQI